MGKKHSNSGVNLKGENYLASYHEATVSYNESIAEKGEKKEVTRWDTLRVSFLPVSPPYPIGRVFGSYRSRNLFGNIILICLK